MKRAAKSASSRMRKGTSISGPGKLREVMVIAEEQGLLRGERNQVVRGRMPKALVAQAKKRTGVVSDTDLIELALANIAVADDYADWLLARRAPSTARQTLNSEFQGTLRHLKPEKHTTPLKPRPESQLDFIESTGSWTA